MITLVRLYADSTDRKSELLSLVRLQGALERWRAASAPNTMFNLTDGVIVTDCESDKVNRLLHVLNCWKVRYIVSPFPSEVH